MDGSRITVVVITLLAAYGFVRFVFQPVSRTGDLMASLFVPPDRALGWPHGIQERDDPWAWRPAEPALEVLGPVPPTATSVESGQESLADIDPGRPSGPFVVAVERVRSIRFTVRPH